MKRVGVLMEEHKPAMLGVIAAGQGHELWALTLEGGWQGCEEDLREHGVARVVDVRSEADSLTWGPDVRARAVTRAVRELRLEVLLGPASSRDLLGRVAAALEAPLLLDCLDVDLETSTAAKLVYSGKSVATIRAHGTPAIFGLRRREGDGGDSLAEAEIVISGGRGMRGGENFAILQECAEVLGAAVGASRVAVDAGWVPHSMQVGLTGTTVSPRLYIACGISGAAQHFAGMGTAGILVAINTDRDSAMMRGCDYGIVGDLFEIVPILTRQLKKSLTADGDSQAE